MHDSEAATAALPMLPPSSEASEAVAATGTDGPMSDRFSLHLPYAEDGSSRTESDSSAMRTEGMISAIPKAGNVELPFPSEVGHDFSPRFRVAAPSPTRIRVSRRGATRCPTSAAGGTYEAPVRNRNEKRGCGQSPQPLFAVRCRREDLN